MAKELCSYCYECHMGHSMQTARALGDDKTALAFGRELMQMYLNTPEGVSSAHFGPATADLLQKYYGLESDRFRREKQESNRFVMERLDAIRGRIQGQADPVFAALQFAILGNYLDFSALQGQVSYEKLEEMLLSALDYPLDEACYVRFCRDLEKGKKLLYLTDNAGEIGFDRLLAEEIRNRYPHLEILFCVRGGPAANDALREDAQAVGIPFPVIDSGSRVGGMELSDVSPEALDAFRKADVILAKGMGNCETLYGCGDNVYYAFLVKCRQFMEMFGKPMYTPMFVSEQK